METTAASVTIYSLPGCLQCRRLKTFLDQHAVRFEEVNVLTRPKALARIAVGYQPMLPLVLLDGQALCAPNLRRIAAALGLSLPRHGSPARRRPPLRGAPIAATPACA